MSSPRIVVVPSPTDAEVDDILGCTPAIYDGDTAFVPMDCLDQIKALGIRYYIAVCQPSKE